MTTTAPLPRLTERRKEALDWITWFIQAHNRAPYLREIAQALFVTTPAAQYHVNKLIEAGYLQRTRSGNGWANLELAPRYRAQINA